MKKMFPKFITSGLILLGAFGASAQVTKTPTEVSINMASPWDA